MAVSAVETIGPEDATDHVGENGTVRGVVALPHYAARSKSQPTFLNPAKTYPEQIFTAAIFVAIDGERPATHPAASEARRHI